MAVWRALSTPRSRSALAGIENEHVLICYPQTLDFKARQTVERHGIGQGKWQAWLAKVGHVVLTGVTRAFSLLVVQMLNLRC